MIACSQLFLSLSLPYASTIIIIIQHTPHKDTIEPKRTCDASSTRWAKRESKLSRGAVTGEMRKIRVLCFF